MRLKGQETSLLLLLAVAVTAVVAGGPSVDTRAGRFDDWRAVDDSLSGIHPRLRNRWLNERGLELPGINAPLPVSAFPDSSGLQLVGKYGRGPSVEVTGRDSLVFLSLGSEVAIFNFAEPDSPRVLAEVQALGLVTQAALRDSFLYVGCKSGQAGIEVWNVGDPTNPVFRSRAPTLLSDFCVRDTFLYLTQSLSGQNDTFKVYSIADPENVYMVGSCRDSGDAVTVTNNTAFLADRWGLYAIDVSDPGNPHRVGSYPGVPIAVEARNSICCVTFVNPNEPEWLEFDILDVSNPASMRRLGFLSDAGGYDIFLAETLAFLSGYYTGGHGFQIVDVGDSTSPTVVCARPTPGAWGVWCSLQDSAAFLADRTNGMVPVDIGQLGNPQFGAKTLSACETQDICVQDRYAYLANLGLKVLDLSEPSVPREVGHVDAAYRSQTVAVQDSFAFAEWRVSYNVASIDVADPTSPVPAGGCMVTNPPEDMVLRDSFLYIAEDYRFQVVNVVRPREPQVVGTLNLPERSRELILDDTVAYIGCLFSAIVVNVARPSAPESVGSWPGRVNGIDLVDTMLFVVAPETLWAVNVADPQDPVTIGYVPVVRYMHDVVVVDTVAYCVGWSVQAVSVADPANMRVVGGHWTPVNWVRRALYESPYLYFCCTDGGVCIMETLQTALVEAPETRRPRGIRVEPSVTTGRVRFWSTEGRSMRVSVYSASGARAVEATAVRNYCRSGEIDLSSAPGGVYLLRFEADGGSYHTTKVVKTTGR